MTISVTTYGAVGDGSTDDTISINAAIAAAKPGDIVQFPGTNASYRITGPINVNKRITLQGGGSKIKSTVGSAISVTADNATIEGLYLEGSRLAGQVGITSTAGFVTIQNCNINLYDTGIDIASGVWQRVEKIRMRNMLGTVMSIRNVVGTVVDDVRYDTDTGTYPMPANGILLNGEGCAFNDLDIIHAGAALHVVSSAAHSPFWTFFENCSFDTSTYGCLVESNIAGKSVNGLMFTNCWFSSHSTSGFSVKGSQTLDGISLNGCHFINNGMTGFELNGAAKNVNLKNCVFSGNSVAYPNTYPAIYLNGSGNKRITGCEFGTWGGFAMRSSLDLLRDTADGPCILTENVGEKGYYSASPTAPSIGFNFGPGWPTR